MSIDAIIIYEDQAVEIKEFGPHNLLCACVADELCSEVYGVRNRLKLVPAKGSGKLLSRCSPKHVDMLARQGQVVIALIDDDRVHELLGLDKSTCRPGVLEEFRRRVDSPQNLIIVLLERNIENVATAAGEVLGLEPDEIDAATNKKSLNARDALLNRCAFKEHPDQRKKLLEKVPTFGRLVGIVVKAIADIHESRTS